MKIMISENSQRLIYKLKHGLIRMYYSPNQAPNFTSEIAYQNYLNYKNFTKTGLFYHIVSKHSMKIEKKIGV